tara:strand:+ start:283001 stop:283513 length:513 start_codon:yes stop_codon:yes gene_type:complete
VGRRSKKRIIKDESYFAAQELRNHRYYRLLLSLLDEHPHRDGSSHLHSSLIVKGGSILGRGVNAPFVTAFGARYAYHCNFQLHSEFAAVASCRRKSNLRGCTIYNAKVNAHGKLRNSKPCPSCRQMLFNYGIKKVVYSTDTGIEVMKLNEDALIPLVDTRYSDEIVEPAL